VPYHTTNSNQCPLLQEMAMSWKYYRNKGSQAKQHGEWFANWPQFQPDHRLSLAHRIGEPLSMKGKALNNEVH